MQDPTIQELSASQLQKIDEVCNDFEAACKTEQAPLAEAFVAKVDQELRSTLLPELLQLELHYHPDRSHDDLSNRFPNLDKNWLRGLDRPKDDGAYPAIPGYFIIEELGRGGMGVVYRAADLSLHRHVALKMIHGAGQISEEHRRRFLGEARAVARLHHPQLVQVFDAGEFEGHPFLVFELVEGGTLAERLCDGPLGFQKSAELMKAIGIALQFAHDRHVIHRDLKPSNILLSGGGDPQISDFGLAKLLDDEGQDTLSGVVVGTPSYMAPEQAVGLAGASSPAVDVYSLGAILYELLTGRPPFKAASVVETLDLLRTTEPTRPRELCSSVPRDLETICLKCLQKEPTRRYISAQVFAEELGRFRRGETIVARPVSSLERIARWCRRHPLPASLAVALTFAIVAGFAAVSWQWNEAVTQRTLAEQNASKFQSERDRAIVATNRAEKNAAYADEQQAIAERNWSASERRFGHAQQAVQELIRLGALLVKKPQMEAQGRKALEKASQFRRALLEEKSDDPEVIVATANSLGMLAWNLLEHGEFVEAESTFQESLSLLRKAQASSSDPSFFLSQLRTTSSKLAVALYWVDEYEASEKSSRESVGYAEQIASQAPDNLWHQNALGNALGNWAPALKRVGKREEAVEALRRSVDIHRAISEQRPKNSAFRSNLALVLSSLADHLWKEDRTAAQVLAIEALELRRMVLEQVDKPRNEAMYLMRSLRQVASWYELSDRPSDAKLLLAEAISVGRTARTSFPEYFGARALYVYTLGSARRFAQRQGDKERAESLLIELRRETPAAATDFPEDDGMKQRDLWHRHEWGTLLAERGETEEGMALVMSSLRELCQLQEESSSPKQFRADILAVVRASSEIGGRFDFEKEKQEAARERATQTPGDSIALTVLARRSLLVEDESLRAPVAAEILVRRALEIDPENPDCLATLGIALYYQDKLDEALNVLRPLEEQFRLVDPAAWCYAAMIHSQRGDGERARELIEKAHAWQRKQPKNKKVHWLLDKTASLLDAEL
jgi:Protein kinase domain